MDLNKCDVFYKNNAGPGTIIDIESIRACSLY